MASPAATPADIVRDLPALVAHAREHALLGAYEVSLDFFERASSSVARYMRHVVDSDERARWSRAREDLAAEVKLVKELMRELAVFKRPPGGGAGAGGVRSARGRAFEDEDGAGADGGSAACERGRYSDAQRGSPDADLIDRLEREILDLAPNVKWGDIAGLGEAKGVLQEAVVLPLMCPGFFSGIRKPWRGVLLYGPPGTGKTLLAKAVATECRTTFFNVSASSLASKWRGDAEKLVRILFDMAAWYAPTVLFFDEVDAIASKRSEGEHEASRRMKTEMMVRMDGIVSKAAADAEAAEVARAAAAAEAAEAGEGGVDSEEAAAEASAAAGARMIMVLGATNQPWELDDAFKRRFEKRIHIPLPGKPERVALFRICLGALNLARDVSLDALADLTEHYSGADVAVVCKHAAYAPMRAKQAAVAKLYPPGEAFAQYIAAIKGAEAEVRAQPLVHADFLDAIAANKPSASGEGLKRFAEYAAEHGAV